MTRIHGLILAGGEGSRLGHVRKGELRVAGVRMIDRVARALAGTEPGLLVSTGREHACPLPPPAIALPDSGDHATGPLAGLRTAAAYLARRAAPRDILVSVAVDTPFLPPDYLARLVSAVANGEAAYSGWGDGFYPTNAAWRLNTLCNVLEKLDDSAGPKAALALARATKVDWSAGFAANPFANANTMADLIALQRRARLA